MRYFSAVRKANVICTVLFRFGTGSIIWNQRNVMGIYRWGGERTRHWNDKKNEITDWDLQYILHVLGVCDSVENRLNLYDRRCGLHRTANTYIGA